MALLFTGLTKHSSNFTGSETAANLNSANAKTVTVKAKWKSNEPTIPTGACTGSYGSQQNVNLAVNGTKDFSYTGSVTCAYLQKAGYYKLEVWGAQSGPASYETHSSPGGYGGYAYGKIHSSAKSSIYIIIGKNGVRQGQDKQASYNGGGYGHSSSNAASSGGGATHISTYNCGELKNCESYKGTYDSSKGTYDGGNILIVAGGGGGPYGACNDGLGASGGGYRGANGLTYCYGGGGGGTQNGGGTAGENTPESSTASSFGVGGSRTKDHGDGGGGGWYGGGASGWAGGGGGSGYIGNSMLLQDKGMYMYSTGCYSSSVAATKTTCTNSTGAHVANAANTGNGYAKITYLGT